MLEKQIEGTVCKYAQSKKFLTYKFTSPARTSVPDRILISPEGVTIFIEFKKKGGKATPGQEREIARLKKQNAAVFIVSDIDAGKHLVDMVSLGVDPRKLMC